MVHAVVRAQQRLMIVIVQTVVRLAHMQLRNGRDVGERLESRFGCRLGAVQRIGLHDALAGSYGRPVCGVRFETTDLSPLLDEMKDDEQPDAEHADDHEHLAGLHVGRVHVGVQTKRGETVVEAIVRVWFECKR